MDLKIIQFHSEPNIPFFWETISTTHEDANKLFGAIENDELFLTTYHQNRNVERTMLIKKLKDPLPMRDLVGQYTSNPNKIYVKILKTYQILDKNGKDVSNSEQIVICKPINGSKFICSRGKYVEGLRDGAWSFLENLFLEEYLQKLANPLAGLKIDDEILDLKKIFKSSNTIKYKKGAVVDQNLSFFDGSSLNNYISGMIKNNKMIGKWKSFSFFYGDRASLKSPYSQIDFGLKGASFYDSKDKQLSNDLNFSFQGSEPFPFMFDIYLLSNLTDLNTDEEWVAEWYQGFFEQVKCKVKNGLLEGSFEGYRDGDLACKCNFKDGDVDGKIQWFAWGQETDLDVIHEVETISGYFTGAYGWACSFDENGKVSSIIHEILGYWSNYSDPIDTFKVEFRFKDDKLTERTITQYEFWGVPSTEIVKETFNKKGEMINSNVHEVLERHNAYKGNTLIDGDFSYDDDDDMETLLCRTVELINDNNIIELENLEHMSFNPSYIFGFFNSWEGENLKDKFYYAYGKKYGVSMHFKSGCSKLTIDQIRASDGRILWDNKTGTNTKNLKVPKVFKIDS